MAKDRILAKEARTKCLSRGRDCKARIGREAAGSENKTISSRMKSWDEKWLGMDVVQDQSHKRGERERALDGPVATESSNCAKVGL